MVISACPQLRVHRYAVLTACATFLLLIAGALVTSTDSGLAVPDWPRAYGMWFPPMVGGVRYEHGHRLIAAAVALMVLVLAGWLWRVEARRWVRWLGVGASGLIVLQALLGGATVLLMLPPGISVAHACLGQAVFCLVVCLAACTAPGWSARGAPLADPRVPSLRSLGGWTAGLAAGQLLVGAILRHTGAWLLAHLVGATALVVGVHWLGWRLHRTPGIPTAWRAGARRLMGLLGLQLVLGLLSLRAREHVVLLTLHVGTGALFLAQSIVLAWHLVRGSRPADGPVSRPQPVEAAG